MGFLVEVVGIEPTSKGPSGRESYMRSRIGGSDACECLVKHTELGAFLEGLPDRCPDRLFYRGADIPLCLFFVIGIGPSASAKS